MKNEPDREQDLVEVALAIDVHIERALEQRADKSSDDEGGGQAGKERHARPVHQNKGDVAARHGEGAVSEIDEIHEAERDREPACQHEQQHAIGDAVEKDGQHSSPLECAPLTY